MEEEKIIVCRQSEITGAPNKIKLLPLGFVESEKGNFTVDEESFDLIKKQFLKRGNDVVIDYEHQTLKDVQAPAGGWIKDLELSDGAIMAHVEWTPHGKQYIENREYRYLSPVVLVRKRDQKAVALHSVALTNTPAIDSMYPIINKTGDEQMDFIKKFAALLGLSENATEEQIMEAFEKILAEAQSNNTNEKPDEQENRIVSNKVICELLGVPKGAKTEDVAAAILALKSGERHELLELKRRLDEKDANEKISRAMKSGKLTPPLKEWAVAYALKDPAGYDAFIAQMPEIVPMGEIDFGPDTKEEKTVDSATLKVCKMLGVLPEDLEKYKGAD